MKKPTENGRPSKLVAGGRIELLTRGFSVGFSPGMTTQLYATSLINKKLIAVERLGKYGQE